MEIDGRFSILQGRTPTGETFQCIDIFLFSASNPPGKNEMWNTTENWIIKQEKLEG